MNKVEGHPTEANAVERGMELLENNKLWAVVSFLNIEETNGTLEDFPPFITYKIRYLYKEIIWNEELILVYTNRTK